MRNVIATLERSSFAIVGIFPYDLVVGQNTLKMESTTQFEAGRYYEHCSFGN